MDMSTLIRKLKMASGSKEQGIIPWSLCYCDNVLPSLQGEQRGFFVHSLLNVSNFCSFMTVYQPYALQQFLSLNWNTVLVLFKSATRDRAYIKHENGNQMWLTQTEREK